MYASAKSNWCAEVAHCCQNDKWCISFLQQSVTNAPPHFDLLLLQWPLRVAESLICWKITQCLIIDAWQMICSGDLIKQRKRRTEKGTKAQTHTGTHLEMINAGTFSSSWVTLMSRTKIYCFCRLATGWKPSLLMFVLWRWMLSDGV